MQICKILTLFIFLLYTTNTFVHSRKIKAKKKKTVFMLGLFCHHPYTWKNIGMNAHWQIRKIRSNTFSNSVTFYCYRHLKKWLLTIDFYSLCLDRNISLFDFILIKLCFVVTECSHIRTKKNKLIFQTTKIVSCNVRSKSI